MVMFESFLYVYFDLHASFSLHVSVVIEVVVIDTILAMNNYDLWFELHLVWLFNPHLILLCFPLFQICLLINDD